MFCKGNGNHNPKMEVASAAEKVVSVWVNHKKEHRHGNNTSFKYQTYFFQYGL
jgi:hypothetical protein